MLFEDHLQSTHYRTKWFSNEISCENYCAHVCADNSREMAGYNPEAITNIKDKTKSSVQSVYCVLYTGWFKSGGSVQ